MSTPKIITTDDVVSKEIAQIEREKLANMYSTARTKVKLIHDLKNGLGAEIKANPNKIKIVKRPITQRLNNWIKKILTIF